MSTLRSWIKTGNLNLDLILSNKISTLDKYILKDFFKDFDNIDDFLELDSNFNLISICNYCNIETFNKICKIKTDLNEKYECLIILCQDNPIDILDKVKKLLDDKIIISEDVIILMLKNSYTNIMLLDLLLSNMSIKPKLDLNLLHETNLHPSYFKILFKHYHITELYMHNVIDRLIELGLDKYLETLKYIIESGYIGDILYKIIYKGFGTKKLEYVEDILKLGSIPSLDVIHYCLEKYNDDYLKLIFEYHKDLILEYYEKNKLLCKNISLKPCQYLRDKGIKFIIHNIRDLSIVSKNIINLIEINPNIINQDIVQCVTLNDYQISHILSNCNVNTIWSKYLINSLYLHKIKTETDLYPIEIISLMIKQDHIDMKYINEICKRTINPPKGTLHNIIRNIHFSNESRSIHILEIYCKAGFNLDEDIDGTTPLLICFEKTLKKCIKILIKYGASIYKICNRRCAISYIKIEYVNELFDNDNDNLFEQLESLDFDILWRNNDYSPIYASPVINYIYNRDEDKAIRLIAEHKYYDTNFLIGHFLRDLNCFKMMISHCKDINQKDSDGNTILFLVCKKIKKINKKSRESILDLILNRGSDVDISGIHIESRFSQNPKITLKYPIDFLINFNKDIGLYKYILAQNPKYLPDIEYLPLLNEYRKNGYFWEPEHHKYFTNTFQKNVLYLYLINYRLKDKFYHIPKFVLFMIIHFMEKS